MIKEWTIDTHVLYIAADIDIDATNFLMRVLEEKHWVNFDHKGLIQKEYEKCLKKVGRERKGGYELVNKWFKNVVAKLAMKLDGKLNQRHRSALEKLKFDYSDWPFVAVCSNSGSKKLVSGDSDYYKQDVKFYLKSKMAVIVLTIRDSLAIIKNKA